MANFLKREDGPTAVEYAVMLALIIVVCIAAISALGSNASKHLHLRRQHGQHRRQLKRPPERNPDRPTAGLMRADRRAAEPSVPRLAPFYPWFPAGRM